MRKWIFGIILFLLFGEKVFAYPNYISFGYQSCMSCHYNPYGNGPLTDYGRAVGASALAGRSFFGKKMTDEVLADRSGFLFSKPNQNWFRPSLSYRGLYYKPNVDQANSRGEYITMDAGGALVLKFLNDRLIFSGNLSYAPIPKSMTGGQKIDQYRTREHYLGFRLNKEWGIYAGLMDKVFGLRVPDHIAVNRMATSLGQNDQTHGVLLHYLQEKFEWGLHGFIGNLVQENTLRQKGLSTQFDYSLAESARIGFSILKSESQFTDYLMGAVHTRLAAGKGHSLMIELGQVSKGTKATQKNQQTQYIFLQTHLMAARGVFPFLSAEYQRSGNSQTVETYRFGPGLQYMPMQRVELRVDLLNAHRTMSSQFINDSWDFMGQVHLWF